MQKYVVAYDFYNAAGEWKHDTLTNNGKGFSRSDAENVAIQIRLNAIETRDVRVERMR